MRKYVITAKVHGSDGKLHWQRFTSTEYPDLVAARREIVDLSVRYPYEFRAVPLT